MWPQPDSIYWAKAGCPLSATLFGIFIDGLHHHLQTMAPAAGVQVRHLKLTDLVYVDETCLLAGNPQNLQALIDALVDYCSTLRMEISVAKTKVMVVSKPSARSLAPTTAVSPAMVFQWGALTHLYTWVCTIMHQAVCCIVITPLKANAAGSWAVVQQRHCQLQCGYTVNLELLLLPSILVPSLHFSSHKWPVVVGRLAESQHVVRANRVCTQLWWCGCCR